MGRRRHHLVTGMRSARSPSAKAAGWPSSR